MLAYASRTGTAVNLDALRRAGWRLLVSATGVWRHEGFPYCLDNGAWTAHQQGTAWDERRFLDLILLMGEDADFVVMPDVVLGGVESLRLSLRWLERLWWLSVPRLIPVQDGMHAHHLRGWLGNGVGIFIGGSDGWKEQTAREWGKAAEQAGVICHMGRVNSQRRLRIAFRAGCHSFDGSSASKFMVSLGPLERTRQTEMQQQTLWKEDGPGGVTGPESINQPPEPPEPRKA
jgi:hypothetical protein